MILKTCFSLSQSIPKNDLPIFFLLFIININIFLRLSKVEVQIILTYDSFLRCSNEENDNI